MELTCQFSNTIDNEFGEAIKISAHVWGRANFTFLAESLTKVRIDLTTILQCMRLARQIT